MNTFERNAESTDIPEDWISATERQATLPLSFDDFYNNADNVSGRDKLLGKISV